MPLQSQQPYGNGGAQRMGTASGGALQGRQGAVLLVDECFADFLEEEEHYSVCNALAQNCYVAVLRAFTKMYAMAGVRLGYLLSSNQNLLERMAEAGPPWNVSTIASRCGIAALTCREHVERTKKVVVANRAILAAGLQKRKFRVYPSLANYLLFRSRFPNWRKSWNSGAY